MGCPGYSHEQREGGMNIFGERCVHRRTFVRSIHLSLRLALDPPPFALLIHTPYLPPSPLMSRGLFDTRSSG